jgi:protein TonB
MDFARQQRNPARHLPGISFVILFHIIIVYALVNGLARKVVEVVKGPLETKLIEELKKPPPDTPPPPPPKLAPPPPPYIPPPEVNIAAPVTNTTAIASVTHNAPVAPPPPAQALPTPAKFMIGQGRCQIDYPAQAKRLEQAGSVILQVLVDPEGNVIDSKVDTSSGFQVLDDAARAGLSRCRASKPATENGKPVQAWSRLKYTFRLTDR